MSELFTLENFVIEEYLSSSTKSHRYVYKIRSTIQQLHYKCYQFVLNEDIQSLVVQALYSGGGIVPVWGLPRVFVFPNYLGDQSRVEMDLVALLHALTILRDKPTLQVHVHQFEEIYCRVDGGSVYMMFPWLDGVSLNQIVSTETEMADVRGVNAVLEMLSMFHSEGVCIHDVSIQQVVNGKIIPGNIWFVDTLQQLSCRLIDVESLMYIDAVDSQQKSMYFESPCFSKGYISNWIIEPVDEVHDIFQRYRRGDAVYGWHVDVILSLALLQDAGKIGYQVYVEWIASMKIQHSRPTISPPFSLRLGDVCEVIPDIPESNGVQRDEVSHQEGDSSNVESPNYDSHSGLNSTDDTRQPSNMGRYFAIFVVLGLICTYWLSLENTPSFDNLSFELPTLGYGSSPSNLDPLYESEDDATWDSAYLTALDSLQKQYQANSDDVDAYADILFLKTISPSVDECGVWYDSVKGRKFKREYVLRAYQRPICQRLYQEVKVLREQAPRNRSVQRAHAFWLAMECIATIETKSSTSLPDSCEAARALTHKYVERAQRSSAWMFWELSRLYLTLDDVVKFPSHTQEHAKVCERVFEHYGPEPSQLLQRRMLQSTKRCWSNAELKQQFRYMRYVVSRSNFSPKGWHYQLSGAQCADTQYQANEQDWKAESASSYCSWLSKSLGDEQLYPLPNGLVLSNWCTLDAFDILSEVGLTVCTKKPDQFHWIESYERLQSFLPVVET